MRIRVWYLWVAIVGLAAGISPAQQPATPYDIEGTVVDLQTGTPLAKAVVTVDDPTPRIVLTDSNGQFKFAAVTTEPAVIHAGKQGFLGHADGSPSTAMASATVNSKTGLVRIALNPASGIYGRVTSDEGNPIEDIPVTLFYRGPYEGEERLVRVAMTNSDEGGGFSFSNLPGGKYFILAGPKQGRTLIPVQHSRIPAENFGALFYPGVPDPHQAAPIDLRPGQDLYIDFSLKRVRLFTVRGQIAGWKPTDNASLQVTSRFGPHSDYDTQFDAAIGAFRISQVPRGVHTIRVFTPSNLMLPIVQQELTVGSDISGLKVSMSGPRTIPVLLNASDRRAEHGSVSITLKPEDLWQDPVAGFFRKDSSVEEMVLRAGSGQISAAIPDFTAVARCRSKMRDRRSPA